VYEAELGRFDQHGVRPGLKYIRHAATLAYHVMARWIAVRARGHDCGGEAGAQPRVVSPAGAPWIVEEHPRVGTITSDVFAVPAAALVLRPRMTSSGGCVCTGLRRRHDICPAP